MAHDCSAKEGPVRFIFLVLGGLCIIVKKGPKTVIITHDPDRRYDSIRCSGIRMLIPMAGIPFAPFPLRATAVLMLSVFP